MQQIPCDVEGLGPLCTKIRHVHIIGIRFLPQALRMGLDNAEAQSIESQAAIFEAREPIPGGGLDRSGHGQHPPRRQ